MTVALPLSASMAWWLTAWLRGHEPTDALLDQMSEADRLVTVVSSAQTADRVDAGGLVELLRAARASGSDQAGLAYPTEGDLVGLGGPAAFNAAAVDSGEAVVIGSLGLVPVTEPGRLEWHAFDARRRQVPAVPEADTHLRTTLLRTANALADLDVARWSPEAADLIMAMGAPDDLAAPAGTPLRCVDLAVRAVRAEAIVEAALHTDGAALSASEMQARRDALTQLGASARRALVAACSPHGWPPA